MHSSTAFASPFAGRGQQFARAYKTVGVETGVSAATPHRLVQMLFDGFVDALNEARGAMQSGQIETKGRAIGRAVRIIDEGLKAALNVSEGGALALDLQDLYTYMTLRLTQANFRNDPAPIDECLALVQPLREAWGAIAAQVEVRP